MRTREVLGDKAQLFPAVSHFRKEKEIQIVKCLAFRYSADSGLTIAIIQTKVSLF